MSLQPVMYAKHISDFPPTLNATTSTHSNTHLTTPPPQTIKKKEKKLDRCLSLSPSLWGTPGKVEASGNEFSAPPDALPCCALAFLSATDYAFCFLPLSGG